MAWTDIFKSDDQKAREAKRDAMRKALADRQNKNRYGNLKGNDKTAAENAAAADEGTGAQ